jgi:hypothetical protein
MTTILVTLDDLKNTATARTTKEASDRAALRGMFDTDSNGMVDKLHAWAGAGFRENAAILSTALTTPGVCADGVTRTQPEYVAYLLGTSIDEAVAALQAKVAGVTFGWTMPEGLVQLVVTMDLIPVAAS